MQGIWGGGALAQPRRGPDLRPRETPGCCHPSGVSPRNALAPSFGGQKNQVQALKVSAYSSTAAWVVGVVGIFPNVGILAILGLYSLYLLWAGLPVCMKSPKEKATAYTIVVILVGIVLYFVIGAVAAIFMPSAYSMGGLRTS